MLRIATLVVAMLLVSSQPVAAKDGMLVFGELEYSFNSSLVPPSLGWKKTTFPLNGYVLDDYNPTDETKIAWLRFKFSREELGSGPFAISINATSQIFEAFINNRLVFSNLANSNDGRVASYQPYFIPISDSVLTPSSNFISLRIYTNKGTTLTLDDVRIGQNKIVKKYFDMQYFAQFSGPQLANAALIAMTLFALVLWLTRRQETVLTWLTILGIFGVVNNLHHLLPGSPVDSALLRQLINIAPFLIMFSILGFAIEYFHIAKEKLFILIVACTIVIAIVGRYLLLILPYANITSLLLAIPAVAAITSIFLKEVVKSPRGENLAIFVSMLTALISMIHDIGFETALWHGTRFGIMPYASIMMFGTFSFAVGKRLLTNLAAKEDLAAQLSHRIETTKANLLVSESARRTLEISNAITLERERMMREIHDGIGSSLMAALASAERQGKQSNTAVIALKSALTDLRIAVDSLEPVEGNVTTLLASLRYRIEPELKKANIQFDWEVDDLPELDWLDAPNALHVLRIFQEAFGNILGHANATRIGVSCKMQLSEGRPGITIKVSDNGCGFNLELPPQGRGRKNMADRAEALGGKLSIQSAPNAGCSTILWLPFIRSMAT
jgi:signal transduction histidine kinase